MISTDDEVNTQVISPIETPNVPEEEQTVAQDGGSSMISESDEHEE